MQVITTQEGRVAYPSIFKAKKVEINGVAKIDSKTGQPVNMYSVVLIFPKNSQAVKELKAAVVAAAKEKFGDKIPASFRNPIKDGDENLDKKTGEIKTGFEGMNYIQFQRREEQGKPTIVDTSHQEILDPNEAYGGCYAKINANVAAYDVAGGKGVNFYMNAFMKTKDGERLGGPAPLSLEEAFGAPSAAGSENPKNYSKKKVSSDDSFDDLMS